MYVAKYTGLTLSGNAVKDYFTYFTPSFVSLEMTLHKALSLKGGT